MAARPNLQSYITWAKKEKEQRDMYEGGIEGINIKTFLVSVYLDDRRVYEYDVANPMVGREHAAAIIKSGYRSTDDQGGLVWYPPHRILKVKVEGGAESSKYRDRVRPT